LVDAYLTTDDFKVYLFSQTACGNALHRARQPGHHFLLPAPGRSLSSPSSSSTKRRRNAWSQSQMAACHPTRLTKQRIGRIANSSLALRLKSFQ